MKREKAKLIKAWNEKVKEILPSTRKPERLALIDVLPEFLDQLSAGLNHKPIRPLRAVAKKKTADEEHIELPPYSLAQILLEYRVLREVIFGILEKEGLLPQKQRDAIFGAIQSGMTEAASEYVKIRALREQIALHEAESAIQRLQDLQSITELALAKTTNLEALLEGLLARVRTIFSSESAIMLLLSEDHKSFMARASYPAGISVERPFEIVKDHASIHDIVTEGKTGIFEDRGDIVLLTPSGHAREPKMLVCIPLRVEGETIGILQLGFIKPRKLHDAEQSLIQLVAERTAVAVNNASSYEKSHLDNKILKGERVLRSGYISIISHDLRNPLSAAQISAQLLLSHKDKPELMHRLVARIVSGIYQADKTIADLINLNRIMDGTPLHLMPEKLNMNEMVNAAIEKAVLRHGDRFVLHEAAAPVTGYWSRQELERLLEILIENTVRHSQELTPVLLALATTDGRMSLSVHDRSSLLTPEELRMFDLPINQQPEHRDGRQSWAMSITLARGLTAALSGSLSAQSDTGTGTLLIMTLPLDSRSAS